MNDNDDQPKQQMLLQAHCHLRAAIELLDQASAPGQIAAHVDLAVNQLAEELSKESRLDGRHFDRRDCGTIETF